MPTTPNTVARPEGFAALNGRAVVSPGEAAQILGCSRGHIYNLIAAGTLTRYHVGSLARIRVDDLLRLIGGPDAPAA